MSLILIIIILLLLFGGVGTLPHWGHSTNWGYGPSSVIWFVLVAVVILVLLGKL